MERHIVAFGGGDIRRMQPYLLSLTRRPNPRVCFFPTASGDSDSVIAGFYKWFAPDGCRRSHLTLFPRDVDDLRGYLLQQDLIFVGGGSTANMLAVWRLHELDEILCEAWEQGVVLSGGSAGSICWFEGGITDSFGTSLAPLRDGLGFLPGSNCPHYDSEPQRRLMYRRYIADGFPPGFAVDDCVGLHFVGTELAEVVSCREGAAAYRVELSGVEVVETRLPVRQVE